MTPPNRAILLVIVTVCSAAGAQRRDGTTVLPVVDTQDLHLSTLSAGGKELKQWIVGIAQDNQGFIWFATDGGLFRYDGYTLKPYPHDPGNQNKIGRAHV